MKKIAFILFMILMVPCCAVYAQDCSERIQSAGRIYEKYKKTNEKKYLEEARKQLVNIKNTPGAPEKCKEQANRLLKEWKPIIKPTSNKTADVEVAPIVVHVDTVVERHVSIDTVVNVVFHHDSLKAKRFYDSESAAIACMNRKDYECAVDNYQTAIAYGRELQLGEDILSDFQNKILRSKKMQFNELLSQAKQKEDEAKQKSNVALVREALTQYQNLQTYGRENQLMNEAMEDVFGKKIDYLQLAEMMFDYVEQADEYYRAREWDMAKTELQTAIDISDTLGWKKGTIFWVHKMDTIDRILGASSNVFDYSTLNEQAYQKMQNNILTILQNTLLRFIDVPQDTMSIDITVMPDGKSNTMIVMNHDDTTLVGLVEEGLAKSSYKLPAVQYYGQPALAKASYQYIISANSTPTVVKRTNKRLQENPMLIGLGDVEAFLRKTGDTVKVMEFKRDCKPFLYGKFRMVQTVAQVNNTTRSGFHLDKYYGTGGPANALLSLIIPGLGRHRVTYGQQKGVATAIFFYLCSAASLTCYGLAFDPHIENQKYTFKDYTTDLKKFFNVKQNWNEFEQLAAGDESEKFPNGVDARRGMYIASLAFAGIAATIYVSDVLYTLIRGSANVARQGKYKKWSVGVFYEPASKTPVLQYNYKIGSSHRR